MIDIDRLTYRIAGRALFEDASARIPEGHRIGLVGPNGAGKSTLLGLVSGALEPDAGTIGRPRGATIGVVAQEVAGGDDTPLDLVLAGDTERARLLAEAETCRDGHRLAEIHARLDDIGASAAPARAAIILAGLGFPEPDQHRPISSFSGGWRMRVALGAALFAEPDLLLLDEPTNHLDLEAALWLEEYLKSYPKTLIMVSHDRDFLNSVAEAILSVEERRLVFYKGDYDAYERMRAARAAHAQALAEKQAAVRAHLQAFIDRFRAKATKARQAQSRIKALARMEPITLALREPETRFAFPDPAALAPPLITLDHASCGYGGRSVLSRLDLRVDPDDRIALLGANGNGKSTLVKLLAGRLEAMSGERRASSKMKVGYFAQHQVDELDLAATGYQLMSRRMGGTKESHVRAMLGRFGFDQRRADTPVGQLSGGEKARLTLALVTHDAPHLLVLDEPTNHLDIGARDALIEALNDYAGAVLLVSHDRRIIELVADRLWLVADGTARPFEGDIDAYRALCAGAPASKSKQQAPQSAQSAKANGARPSSAKLERQLKAAEALVEKLTLERDAIDAELADPGLYAKSGDARLRDLQRRRETLAEALAAAELQWLALAERQETVG